MVFKGDPNFLEFEVSDPDARTKISAFLGHDLPWWGTANANKNRINQKVGSKPEPETVEEQS